MPLFTRRNAPEEQPVPEGPQQTPDFIAGAEGETEPDTFKPEMQAAMLTQKKAITQKDIAEAAQILSEYKQGKANLERRIVDDELWWELRHWESLRRGKRRYPLPSSSSTAPVPPMPHDDVEPSSAWLFNAIMNKHADAMDNYPEPVVLPREQSDEGSAKLLSSIMPVVMEYNDFEQTYNDAWWEKLKHGTGAYGVFWDSTKENGLGDIDIKQIDLLKIFWEPGITDIQQSKNLFIVELVDNDILDQLYPEHKGKMKGNVIDVAEYIYDDNVDTSKKSVVVDWYYKKQMPNGTKVLHYCKFVGDQLLFASENDPQYESGWYEHGKYPVVLDVMFPEKGTPVGFGYVAICKDPQLYIDKLSANILENSIQGTKRRFLASTSTGLNEQDVNDMNKPVLWVEGELDDARIREMPLHPLDSIYMNVLDFKVNELKETVANRDISNGGSTAGATAASAIAALQEAGNKVSRDMLQTSYRATSKITELCVELMRQFYDEVRTFRITGAVAGQYMFQQISNAQLGMQPVGMDSMGNEMFRKPIFDIKISAQKKNPFSRMEENERAKELYGLGFFNPERAQESMGALQMMDFEGIDKVKEQVQQGQTLLNVVQQLSQQIAMITGAQLQQAQASGGNAPQPTGGNRSQNIDGSVMAAQAPQTGMMQRLAKNAKPSVENTSNAAMPGAGA